MENVTDWFGIERTATLLVWQISDKALKNQALQSGMKSNKREERLCKLLWGESVDGIGAPLELWIRNLFYILQGSTTADFTRALT